MAARLTDKQKKKIVADYARLESYNAAAKLNGVSDTTVKRIVTEMGDFAEKVIQKKEQNTQDILEYMEKQRDKVCEIITVGLNVLPERLKNAKTASEVTTALGTLIDKWTAISGGAVDVQEDDALSKSLKEFAENLESDAVD